MPKPLGKLPPASDAPQMAGWRKDQRFPIVYNSSNGRQRLWACWVDGDTVYRTDGFVDGKLKEPMTHKYPGNTLRTGEQQAVQEAEKMWLKRIDHDYVPDPNDAKGQAIFEHVKNQKEQNGGMNRGVRLFGETEISTGTTAGAKAFGSQHRPMLAKKYKDWIGSGVGGGGSGSGADEDARFELTAPGKAIKFPCLAQAKVDGIRALPQIDADGVLLESRNGNGFMHLNHIREEIKRWLTYKGRPEIILDGELYVHRLYRDASGNPTYDHHKNRELKAVERYQFISEACKITRSDPHDFEELVEYWIFDIWDPNTTNGERWELVQELFADYDGDIIKLVPTRIVNSHDEIEEFMAELVGETEGRETEGREGYEFEGLMVRQMSSKYAASTTHQSCLLKYKRFEDEEWQVCGAERCNGGNQDGGIKWICKKTIDGKERQVVAKQMGSTVDSRKLYNDYQKNPNKYNGKWLNIRFNDRTKDSVPRFPRATAFVEDKAGS